ncbi:MAG: hypothetical protein R2697_08740 [Ilumatobacteraceae bacterium]
MTETPGGGDVRARLRRGRLPDRPLRTRSDGVILDALITETPDSDLIPKVVNGLLSRQVNRALEQHAQENSFILL